MKRVKLLLFAGMPNTVSLRVDGSYGPADEVVIEIPLTDYRKIFTSLDDFDGDILTKIYKYYVKNCALFDPIFGDKGFLKFLGLSEPPGTPAGKNYIYHTLTSRWYDMSPGRRSEYNVRPFVTDKELKELGVRNLLHGPTTKDGVVTVKGYKKELRHIKTETSAQRQLYDKKVFKAANETFKKRKKGQRKFSDTHRRSDHRRR